jgi:two-component system LytT family sensor kinase
VLQPVVENAVKHGIAPQLRGGEVRVNATLDGDTLVLVVHDTGVGVSALALESGRRRGVGLSNIERRLEVQYGPAATMAIESEPGAGTIVTIRMPASPNTAADLAGTRSAS